MDNYKKLPLQSSVNRVAVLRALEKILATGRSLPCTVTDVNPGGVGYSIVTVQFETLTPQQNGAGGPWNLNPVTIPKAESQWIRTPTQVGDPGFTVAADTYLGGVSGLGGGTADLTVDYANLTCLVFEPIANVNFGEPPGGTNKPWINGPDGAYISDSGNTGWFNIDITSGTITIQIGDQQIIISTDPSISIVTPSGITALGDTAANIGSVAARAVAAHADLNTLATGPAGIVNQTLVQLMAAVGAAIGASSSTWSTAQAALKTAFEAASFVPNISGILPTIPACSSTVFAKT